MIVRAHITYEHEFDMEVPDDWFDTHDEYHRCGEIIDKDNCLGGDWNAWIERVQEKE